MDFITLTCPRCRTRMTVVRSASPRLVCPRCLTAFNNPGVQEQRVPVPVIPLAAETSWDTRRIAILAVALFAAILVGVIAAFGDPGSNTGKLVLVITLALAVISSINSATGNRAARRDRRRIVSRMLPTPSSPLSRSSQRRSSELF